MIRLGELKENSFTLEQEKTRNLRNIFLDVRKRFSLRFERKAPILKLFKNLTAKRGGNGANCVQTMGSKGNM